MSLPQLSGGDSDSSLRGPATLLRMATLVVRPSRWDAQGPCAGEGWQEEARGESPSLPDVVLYIVMRCITPAYHRAILGGKSSGANVLCQLCGGAELPFRRHGRRAERAARCNRTLSNAGVRPLSYACALRCQV